MLAAPEDETAMRERRLVSIRDLAERLIAEIASMKPSFETARAKRLAEEAVIWAAKSAA